MSQNSNTPKPTPSTTALQAGPSGNLVGRRPTKDEFNGKYYTRATIQKVVGIPRQLAAPGLDVCEFKITVTPNTTSDMITTAACKAPSLCASFTAAHMVKAPSGQYEVSIPSVIEKQKEDFKKNNSGSGNVAATISKLDEYSSTWTIQAEGRNLIVGKMTMRVNITETIAGRESRVLYDAPTSIIMQKVMDRKILVYQMGTPIGRVGVTLSVHPDDSEGFNQRMALFLSQFAGQKESSMTNSILEKCDEITTFAYLWRRYNIIDYRARLVRFFKMYNPPSLSKVDALLNQYKMHEEDLFMNLVLDNGPEEIDLDYKRRADAYKAKYHLHSLDTAAMTEGKRFQEFQTELDKLIDANGPEPDPRSYLYPEPRYEIPESLKGQVGPIPKESTPAGSAPGSASSTSLTPQQIQDGALRGGGGGGNSRTASSPQNSSSPSAGPGGMPSSTSSANSRTDSAASPGSSSSPMSNFLAQGRQSQQPQQRNIAGGGSNNNNNNKEVSGDLWGSFISSLASKRVSSSDIFFLSDDAFLSLMVQVNVNPAHRHLVLAEWRRRAAENLQLTHFVPTDPSFDAVRTELLALTGMQAINLSVLGVVGLRNIEHETTNSARLGLMENKSVERCVYAGEYNLLLRCAERGITAAMTASDAGVCFPRRPFASMEKPTAISVMVCDIIVGFQTNAGNAKEAALAKSDTVAVGPSNSLDASLFVRDVRHVLPRFIVHCHVDPTLVPCPLHPQKQVEYYVVDSQVFACSNCVVLGPHTGKPIVTLDEALQWSRTQLNDLLRDAETVNSSAGEMDRDMAEHLQSVTGDAREKRKMELIESIRREAELRAQEAAKQLDAEMAMQADVIVTQQSRLAPVRAQLTQLTRTLQSTIRQGNPQRAIEVLQHLSGSYDGNEMRGKVNEVKESLSAMPQLNNSRNPWALASGGQISGTHQQQQKNQHSFSQHQRSGSREGSHHGFDRFMEAAGTVAAQRQRDNSGPRSGSMTPPNSYLPLHQSAGAAAAGGGGSMNASNMVVGGESQFHQQQQQQHGNPQQQQLYNKFVNASTSGGAAAGGRSHGTISASPNHRTGSTSTMHGSSPAAMAPQQQQQQQQQGAQGQSAEQQQAAKIGQAGRELLQDGWKAFRNGDVGTARALWSNAGDRYSNTAVGARALAYIAEAIEKDGPKAADHYEKALQLDPTDCLTLFNYGVLLEATGHTFRALQLFESAQRLGDVASGKRARSIRQQQLASNDQ